jgi:hypothetical protein
MDQEEKRRNETEPPCLALGHHHSEGWHMSQRQATKDKGKGRDNRKHHGHHVHLFRLLNLLLRCSVCEPRKCQDRGTEADAELNANLILRPPQTKSTITGHAVAALFLCTVASDCTMLLKLASSSTGLEPSQRAFALSSWHNSSMSHSSNPWCCLIFSQARPISI